jgi:hypothetical protein
LPFSFNVLNFSFSIYKGYQVQRRGKHLKNGRGKPGLKRIGMMMALLFLLFGLTGCQLPVIKQPAAEESLPLIRVEVYFTGNTEPLVGYVRDLNISKSGTLLQGGSSVNYVYDEAGQAIAVFNYARVEYIKVLP